jgi:site-specific DNA-cytosine methylase
MPRKKSYLTATDQFCGAGGSTTGAKKAGIEVKLALNHWERAMAFDDSYIVTGTVKERVKQLGNAVTPPVNSWITERLKSSLQ